MMRCCAHPRQQGTASLVLALVLMTSMTLVTLSTARTQLTETRLAANENLHGRLRLLAESAWAQAAATLQADSVQPNWRRDPAGTGQLGTLPPLAAADGAATRVHLRRAHAEDPVIQIEVLAGGLSDSPAKVRVSQSVRLLGVLAPRGETAPPLVVAGCLAARGHLDVRPRHSDTAQAGDAVWRYAADCPLPALLDVHAGAVVDRQEVENLWEVLFSVDRETFARLAAAELGLPPGQRRYWLAESSGPWQRSLGSEQQPVVLVFPPTTGCAGFAPGVRVVGVVFIDGACTTPLAVSSLDIIGSLVVNGGLDAGSANLRLRHIQVADATQRRLALPVLRAVRIPGSWRDF